MKQTLILIMVLATLAVQGQSFILTPTDLFESTNDSNAFVVDKVYAKNISGSPIDLTFEVVENTAVLNGWSQVMCAGPLCYPSIPATGSLGTVAPGDSVYCQLTTGFSNQVGSGDFLIRIYDDAAPSNTDTALFRYTSVSTVGTKEISMIDVKLYPNPTHNSLSILFDSGEPVDIKLYSLTGELLQSTSNVISSTELDLTELEPGIYTVVGVATNKRFVKSIVKI